ncbi:hypothetical protein [Streptomyces sp. NRRL S-1824]|uniref:hypothetical protein n=1 Tax=Streptomyces sp. NRRL S-1824 TaxID=1463889 RepID=UPI0004C5ED2C|nr:hypothetical protein [Streptomyces sp. NRRL S-1824]
MQLPEQSQQQAQAGQPTPGWHLDPIKEQARQVAAAVDAVYVEKPTSYRDDTPLPIIGDTPPVQQPGRPAMSSRATDASVLMLAAGGTSFLVCGGAALVMWASESADPVVCGIVFGAPTALILAIGRLVGRVKATVEAAPAPVHHHYNGPVTQDSRSITTTTRGVIANTRNQTR